MRKKQYQQRIQQIEQQRRQQQENPYLWILQADPGKYIRTRPAAIIALLKLAEGCLALWLLLPVGRLLWRLLRSFPSTYIPLPDFLARLYDYLPVGSGTAASALVTALLLGLSVYLLALFVEGLALLLLRLSLRGSMLVRYACRVLFGAALLLLVAVAGITAYNLSRGGLRLSLLILPAVCLLLFWLLFRYYLDAATIMRIIHYECSVGYKDTDKVGLKLGGRALLLALLFAVAAIAVWQGHSRGALVLPSPAFFPYPAVWYAGLGLMALKYLAVYSSFCDFRRCHT